MATDDAMDVESVTQGPYGMDVEHQLPTSSSSTVTSSSPTTADDPSAQVPISPDVAESILVARRAVHAFLMERKVEDIVPANSRVVIIDGNVRLRHAFRALLENAVRAAPVIDSSSHQFNGLLSVSDIVDSLLHLYYTRQSDGPYNLSEGLNEHTVLSWLHQRPSPHPSGENARPIESPFMFVQAEAPLFDAVRVMRDARLLHLPILSRDRTLLHTLEHWRVLRFLHRHFTSTRALSGAVAPATDPQHASRLFSLTLSQLSLGTYTNIVTIPSSLPLINCLQTLQQRSLSALPVVDARNQLVEVYSRADAALLAGDGCDMAMLESPVCEVLSGVRGGAPFVGATCRRGEMLGTVFERFERTGVQRLYIVGEAGVFGVISLSDLLGYFLNGY